MNLLSVIQSTLKLSSKFQHRMAKVFKIYISFNWTFTCPLLFATRWTNGVETFSGFLHARSKSLNHFIISTHNIHVEFLYFSTCFMQLKVPYAIWYYFLIAYNTFNYIRQVAKDIFSSSVDKLLSWCWNHIFCSTMETNDVYYE